MRRMSGSNGMPPSPCHQATRTPLKSRPGVPEACAILGDGQRVAWVVVCKHAEEQREVGNGPGHGPRHRQRRPRIAFARHAAGRGPQPDDVAEGRGLRSEPPVSLPSAIGTMPHASATAPPLLLPPHVLARS